MGKMVSSKLRVFSVPVACGLVLALGGCLTGGDRRADPGRFAAVANAAYGQTGYSSEAPTEYRIGPNDSLQIKVYGEPDLSFEKLIVNQNGKINLPFAGEVPASGKTTSELTATLRQVLSRHLLQPQLSVNVIEYGSQRITVEGSVTRSGMFVVPPGTTLLGALALAGEPDRLGLVRQIVVFRTDAQGRSVALFDLRAIRSGKMIDPVLQGNDRVVVGVSGGGRAYQDLLSLIPAIAIFSKF